MTNLDNFENNQTFKQTHTDETLEAALDESVEAAAALSIRANDLVDRLMQRLHAKTIDTPVDFSQPTRMFNPDAGP